MRYNRIGELLVSQGVITTEQLEQALIAQKTSKKRLGQELLDSKVITQQELIKALSIQLGVDYINLNGVSIPSTMINYIPHSLAKEYALVPVKTQGNKLYVAMADPLNFVATEQVRTITKMQIIPLISSKGEIDQAISNLYGVEDARLAIQEMQESTDPDEDSTDKFVQELASSTDSAPSIRLVNNIIERAILAKATDIHIEPQKRNMRVRMRIDGMLHEEFIIPKELQPSIISRVKIMCSMDTTEHRIPQDGSCTVRSKDVEIDLRCSTLPCVYGEKIVLRILSSSATILSAEDLGFYGYNLDCYKELIDITQGIILVSGPTGSGKSTTLQAIMGALNTEEVNITTLEDPVEANIKGINQIQINTKTGLTFANGLRSILRQDPDIITVGEIRDAETADISMRSAMTGHIVLSTLHTMNAINVITRLEDINIDAYIIADALKGVLAQRLVRRVCPTCKEEYTPTEAELARINLKPNDPRLKDAAALIA